MLFTGRDTPNPADRPTPVTSRWQKWRARLQAVPSLARRVVPFASGMIAALGALILYNAFFPKAAPITMGDVNQTVADALASATPPPAYSAQVYQVIQPSLVLIESELAGANGESDHGVGSGVIVTNNGDILTSLHVVAGATGITLYFADGTESSGQIVATQPENDIAVVRANQPPAVLVPAILGNPNQMRVGDEVFVMGNPFGLYGSMSSGVISGFDRSFQVQDTDCRCQSGQLRRAAAQPGGSGDRDCDWHTQSDRG
jgi:S1-C subfamily serine protease